MAWRGNLDIQFIKERTCPCTFCAYIREISDVTSHENYNSFLQGQGWFGSLNVLLLGDFNQLPHITERLKQDTSSVADDDEQPAPVAEEVAAPTICLICFDANANTKYMPCAHNVACNGCAQYWAFQQIVKLATDNTCPICRTAIDYTIESN